MTIGFVKHKLIEIHSTFANIKELEMVAIKTHFDGEKIILPDDLRGLPPEEVIVVYDVADKPRESEPWLRAQEASFAKAWDNDEDGVYDTLR